jgi:hypothetical protein
MAHPFEEWQDCMEARGVEFGQVARDIGTRVFNGANDLAVDFMVATVNWWDSLDTRVQRAVAFAATVAGGVTTVAGGIFFTRIATIVIDAAGLESLAVAGAEVAAGIAAFAIGVAVGAALTAASLCAHQVFVQFTG